MGNIKPFCSHYARMLSEVKWLRSHLEVQLAAMQRISNALPTPAFLQDFAKALQANTARLST